MDQRETNLLEVSGLGNLKAVIQYLSAGVNPNCQHPMNKWSPLHWAVQRNQASVVRYLLANGGDPNLPNNKGQTPFDLADSDSIRSLFEGKVENFNSPPSSAEGPQDKKIKFTPTYLAEPDLSKVWGLPEDEVFNTDSQKPNLPPKEEPALTVSQPIQTITSVSFRKTEVIVFTSKGNEIEPAGTVALLPTDSVATLLLKITEELEITYLPSFKLYKVDKKENLRLPITKKQLKYTIEDMFQLGNNPYYLLINQ